jgi:hypothetical protein
MLSIALPSLMENGSGQLPHADNHTEQKAADEKPWRCAAPPIDGVAKSAKENDRTDERVASTGDRTRALGVLLQALSGASEEVAIVSSHGKRAIMPQEFRS